MSKSHPGGIPWYKEKFARDRYLTKGEPRILNNDIISKEAHTAHIFAITDDERQLWEDHRTTVKNKNKKRDYNITISEPVELTGTWMMTIEVLHTDYQGFKYSAEGDSIKELEETYWPTVTKLLAYYCSPKIRATPPVY